MKEIVIKNVEKTNVMVLIVGSILLLLLSKDEKALVSFALGSGLVIMNLRIIRWIIEAAFGKESKKRWLGVTLPLQFLMVLGITALFVVYTDISPVFFLAGLSTLFISLIINQFAFLGRQKDGT